MRARLASKVSFLDHSDHFPNKYLNLFFWLLPLDQAMWVKKISLDFTDVQQ